MKVKAGVNFHNRFDIEVRDAKTGELKQKGQAENIILDQMYSRLCNFQVYFHSIHFGRGAGTPTPERDTLFDRINSKQATNEEVVRALPTSKWTRRITLMPEEFVGETITEVGIGWRANVDSMVTHAMIKDAEGNPLSITKTELDVVVIYATVFIELIGNTNQDLHFRELDGGGNDLISYLTGGSTPSSTIQLGRYYGNSFINSIGEPVHSKSGTVSVDIPNRTRKISARFGITEGNDEIASIGWHHVFRVNLPSDTFTEASLTGITLGIGDGVQTEYTIPNRRIFDLTVRLDGVVTTDYTVDLSDSVKGLPVPQDLTVIRRTGAVLQGVPIFIVATSGNYHRAYIYYSLDGERIIEILYSVPSWGRFLLEGGSVFVSTDLTHIHINDRVGTDGVIKIENGKPILLLGSEHTPSGKTWVNILHSMAYLTENGYNINLSPFYVSAPVQNVISTIKFNKPVSEGVVVTADYKVPYIPKNSDHVLDVDLELQFGEGV